MKQIRIEEYVNAHNSGKIEIHSISSNQYIMMNNISSKGKLNLTDSKLSYQDPQGNVQSILDLDDISSINYSVISPSNGDTPVPDPNTDPNPTPIPNPPLPDDNGDDSNIYGDLFKRDYSYILKCTHNTEGYVEDGMIFPTVLTNGAYIYDLSYSRLIGNDIYDTVGSVHSNVYKEYFGDDGYLTLNNTGYAVADISLPREGTYQLRIVLSSGKGILGKHMTLVINGIQYSVNTKLNDQYNWELMVPLDFNKNPVDKFLFGNTGKIRMQLQPDIDSDTIDIDSLILLPTMMTGTSVSESGDYITPTIYDDIYAYPVDRASVYTKEDSDLQEGYLIPNDNKSYAHFRLTDSSMMAVLNDGVLKFKINVLHDGYYNLGILVKYLEKNTDGLFKILINGTDSYVSKFYEVPEQSGSDIYLCKLFTALDGNINVYQPTTRIPMNKGTNIIEIRNSKFGLTNNEAPLINALLLSDSTVVSKYADVSNDYGNLVMPNINDINLLQSIKMINNRLVDRRQEMRNSINVLDNYDKYTDLEFQYGIRNINYAQATTDSDKISFDMEVNYKDHNTNDDRTTLSLIKQLKPKVSIVGYNSRPIYPVDKTPDQLSYLSRYIDLIFVLYDYQQMQHYQYLNDMRGLRLESMQLDRHISHVDNFPIYRKFDLGKNWKALYQNMSGLNMADKIYVMNLLDNSSDDDYETQPLI